MYKSPLDSMKQRKPIKQVKSLKDLCTGKLNAFLMEAPLV